MTQVRAVIFDMDGVLIDAREWHYDCLNRALAIFGMTIDLSEHLAMFDGLPTRRKLAMLSEMKGLPTRLHQLINDLKQEFTLEAIITKCRPNFTHEYALSRLKADGYALAVASNSVRKTVELLMDRANLTPYLDFYLSNNDVVKPKPDPEIYLTAIKRLKLEPEQCIVVEDNEYGVQAARASGAHLLRVAGVDETNYENIRAAISALESR